MSGLSGAMAPGAPAMDLLQRRLSALRKALAQAEPQQRKEVIEQKLSPKLRQELIWLIEKEPASGDCHSTRTRRRGAPRNLSWRDRKKVKAGLWTMTSKKGDFYAARLNLCGVVIASKVTRCFQEAQYLRQRLEALGRAALPALPALPAAEAPSFERSFREAVAAGDWSPLGLTFRLVLDLRPWVGRRVHSPAVSSVEALLQLRGRLHGAEVSWPALRQQWLSWMTRERRRRWRSTGLSQEEAEQLISSLETSTVHRGARKRARHSRTGRVTAERLLRRARQAEVALLRVEQRGRKRKR